MKKLTPKKIDALINAAYKKHAVGRRINIFKIGLVFKDAKDAINATGTPVVSAAVVVDTLTQVMPLIVAKYTEPVSSRPPDLNG